MEKPIEVEFDQANGVSILTFSSNPYHGEKYLMRGSVVWPVAMEVGYALLSGYEISSGKVLIFEESPFLSVQTMETTPNLWIFLRTAYEKYRARYFFYTNSPEHRRYFLQVVRDPLITPRPAFVETEYDTSKPDRIDNLILEYQARKKIVIQKEYSFDFPKDVSENFNVLNGNLYKQLKAYSYGQVINEDSYPAVKALRILLAGIERTPYRKPSPPQQIPRSYTDLR